MTQDFYAVGDMFSTTIVAKDCWVCFTDAPSLYSVQEARRLLDAIADDLIREKLNA